MVKSFIKGIMPEFGKRWLNRAGFLQSYKPAIGHIKPGDMGRLTPFSTDFGYDRGGPVDRYYIENFLNEESAFIKGRCMEIGDNEYTLTYGKSNVTQSDILHVSAANPKATLIGDLSNAPQIQDNMFDCIILTQTLHLIYEFKAALATCHRILKPGGTLLLTSPGITPIDHGGWKSTWYWSFTDTSVLRLACDTFPGGAIEVNTFGNVYAASAFLYGMGITEVAAEKLDYKDPHYQVIITLRVTKHTA